jgi:hypothetical protein
VEDLFDLAHDGFLREYGGLGGLDRMRCNRMRRMMGESVFVVKRIRFNRIRVLIGSDENLRPGSSQTCRSA